MSHLAIAALTKGFQDLDLLTSDGPALEVGDAREIQHPSCGHHDAAQLASQPASQASIVEAKLCEGQVAGMCKACAKAAWLICCHAGHRFDVGLMQNTM